MIGSASRLKPTSLSMSPGIHSRVTPTTVLPVTIVLHELFTSRSDHRSGVKVLERDRGVGCIFTIQQDSVSLR